MFIEHINAKIDAIIKSQGEVMAKLNKICEVLNIR